MKYWNFHPDLYQGLEASEIQVIEDATLARRLGRSDEARKIIHGHSFGVVDPIVVVFEKANLELGLGLDVEYLRIIEEARTLHKGSANSLLDLTLRFKICEGATKVHGTLRDGLETIRQLKKEFQEIPMQKWSDLEVCESLERPVISKSGRNISSFATVLIAYHRLNAFLHISR